MIPKRHRLSFSRRGVPCRVLDKFKPGEVCNLVWGLAHLGCQPGADLLQQVVQASQDWSEVSCPVSFLSAVVTGLPFQSAAVIEIYFVACAVCQVCISVLGITGPLFCICCCFIDLHFVCCFQSNTL